ncbi:MAG: hypothetical protein ACKO2P_16590, partial [Planctomycetota bacterium]
MTRLSRFGKFQRNVFRKTATGTRPMSISRCGHAADTLAVGDEPKDDARQCLDGLRWEPRPFDVAIEAAVVGQGDLRVRFPSPCDGGAECNRDVWMEWYRARDAA